MDKHRSNQVRLILLLILVGLATGCGPYHSELTPLQKEAATRNDEAEKTALAFGLIDEAGGRVPVGRFAILRREPHVCAIRFTAFRRGHDAKPPTPFSSGDESLYAEYDWYYQADGSGDFAKSNVEHGHREASRKDVVSLGFLGRFSMRRGMDIVDCGPLRASWGYPNGIALYLNEQLSPDGKFLSNNIEMTLTGWKEITEVNVHDPRLTWYRFDEARDQERVSDEPKLIPVEDLPGGPTP